KYQLQIKIPAAMEEFPPPLTVGAAPALRLRVVCGGPSVSAPPPPPAAPVSPSLPDTASVPSGVLFAMGARPAGAAAESPATNVAPRLEVLERVFAQAPEILLSEQQLLSVTVLTQPPRVDSGTAYLAADSGGWHSAALSEGALAVPLKS